MFGTCLYLPTPANSLTSCRNNEELPLDLSCKPRECPRVSKSSLVFREIASLHQENSELAVGKRNEELANVFRSTISPCVTNHLQKMAIPTKNIVESDMRTISDSIYDTDSDVDNIVCHENESSSSIKDPCHSGKHLLALTDCRQTITKRGRERTLLPCQVCGKAFDRPSLLKRHIRTHTGEKPHVCDVCGKGFSTSSSLNTHRRIHSGEKPHQCPICGKRFTASSNLYYHRMTHVKEKPHKCTMCNKSFPTPGDLKSHMYVHNGSWPFQCHVCKRGFSKQTNLRNHLFLHTGKKPHNCSHCGKCFALACNLRAHMRTHSESGSCLPNISVDRVGNVSEDTSVNSESFSSVATRANMKPEEEQHLVPSITPRLADHVFFWHTIQQQLATNIFVQQQQHSQMNSIHYSPSSVTRPLKFSK